MGRVLRKDELENLAYKLIRRICGYVNGSVENAVLRNYVAIVNGKWFSWIFGFQGFEEIHRVRIIEKAPCAYCFWCDAKLFEPEHKPWHRHCNSRLCRELSAVKNGKHQSISIRWKVQAGPEVARTKILAMFYVRKHQIISKERSDDR